MRKSNKNCRISTKSSATVSKTKASAKDTPENLMTHDVVVGGGHTIEVQKDEGSQSSEFALFEDRVLGRLARSESEGTEAKPNYDGTVGGANDSGATPNADRTIGNRDKNVPLSTVHHRSSDRNPQHAPSFTNSVYDNADATPHIYGDFAENPAKSTDNKRQDCAKSKQKSTEKDRTIDVKSGGKVIKTIVIAGQIEGHTQLPQEQKATRYEELIPQLIEVEESDKIGGLLLILNTVGGDVEAGLALSELIAGMKKPTVSLVLGGGHSIGIPLAVSAKRSFIAPSATMTLHPVRVNGMVLSAPQTYVYLSNMQKRITDFVCSHSNIGSERFCSLMLAREEMSTDLGSVLDGKKAVEEGIIDAIGTLSDAMEYLSSHEF